MWPMILPVLEVLFVAGEACATVNVLFGDFGENE